MKQSLIQSQLTINAFLINMIEKDVALLRKTKLETTMLAKKFKPLPLSPYFVLMDKSNSYDKDIKYAKKKLAKLVELQKSLKKQKKFYCTQMREIQFCVKMLSRAKEPSQYDYYETRYDIAKTKLWMFWEDL